ncbi:phytanoyl-CoA dioxygenase family protein [Staphylococcus saprophyticus]
MNNLTKEFENKGYVNKIKLFDKAEAEEFKNHFNSFIKSENLENQKIKREFHNRHFDLDFIWNIATDKRILDTVQKLIGENIMLIGTRLVCKWPYMNNYSPWHQDSKYQKLNPSKQITVWYAVDDSKIDNGCLYVLPNSHENGFYKHSVDKGEKAQVSNKICLSEDELKQTIPLELNSGEFGVFHGDIVHGSPENSSPKRRCGLVLRYIPTYVQPEINGMWPALLVRGQNIEQNFPELTREEGKNFKYLTK